MERINSLSKILVAIGFTIGIAAWIFGALGFDRSAAIAIFAIGFIIATVGICGGTIFMPALDSEGRSTTGLRVAAIGFAIVAIPTAVGGFLLGKSDDDLNVFFYTGFSILFVGISIHWFALVRRKE